MHRTFGGGAHPASRGDVARRQGNRRGRFRRSGFGNFGSTYIAACESYDSATGLWSSAGSLVSTRAAFSLILLLNGDLLAAGGFIYNGIYSQVNVNTSETYNAGLGFNAAWQPQITSAASPLILSNSLQITGSGFRGVSEASENSTSDSATDFPVVRLRSFENEQTLFALSTNWSTNIFASTAVANFPLGFAYATVFANGISSTSKVLLVSAPAPGLVQASKTTNGQVQLGFSGMPGVSYTVLATTNVALPTATWTPVGGGTDSVATPGQFTFMDPPTTAPRRFYRVRWP